CDNALVDEVHPVLEARKAVRDLREVVHAKVLLPYITEGAVVCRDDGQVVVAQTSPKLRLVTGGSQWGSAHELRPLEAWPGKVVLGEEEVLGTRLSEYLLSAIAGLYDGCQSFGARDVHD